MSNISSDRGLYTVDTDSALRVPVSRARSNGVVWELWSKRLVWLSAMVLAVTVARNVWHVREYRQLLHAVRCDEPVFDFKTAFSGDVLNHTFHVINIGPRSLNITQVIAECGCTTVGEELKGRMIEPGASFEVPVRLTLTGPEESMLERKISVHFEGQPSRRLVLTLRGTVEPRWKWAPETVVIENAPANQQESCTVTMTLHDKAPPTEITRVNASNFLLASFVPTPTTESSVENREWIVTIKTNPPLSAGRRQGFVVIETGDGKGHTGPTIPVTVIVRDGEAG